MRIHRGILDAIWRRLALGASVAVLTTSAPAAQDPHSDHRPEPSAAHELQAPEGVPASSPAYGHALERGPWRVAFHYNAFAGVTRQGSRQDTTEALTVNWFMGMGQRDLDRGRISLRGMLSLEPLLLKREGYPLLLQTGETAYGEPLMDRQHPHDLFMELGARYNLPLTSGLGLETYIAAAGEPALGPVAFPHRPSAFTDPLAPLGHHWQDASHIAFGVVTLGAYTRRMKLEGSWFNGREPDENRVDFDLRAPDSYSGRVTFNPTRDWSLQASYGYLNEPEALEPGIDVRRITASAAHNRRLESGNWASTFVWGRNRPDGAPASNAYLVETTLTFGPHAIFGRAEYVQKSGHDFGHRHPCRRPALRPGPPHRSEPSPLTEGGRGPRHVGPAGVRRRRVARF